MTEAELVAKVRAFMRDNTATNALLDGEESDDTIILLCAEIGLDEFNYMPPVFTSYAITTFPYGTMLVMITVIKVLESAGILQSRNQLQYSDGGITVSVSDKTALYQSWIQLFLSRIWVQAQRIKKTVNIESCYGEVPSEYSAVNAMSYLQLRDEFLYDYY
jgi:hypothetical protein